MKQEISSYLNSFKEEMPAWLGNYHPGDKVAFSDFMTGRVAYYPGSEFDGNLLKVVNMAQCAHAILYVDYMVSRTRLEEHLTRPECVSGYHELGRVEWTEKDLAPNGNRPLDLCINLRHRNPMMFVDRNETPYCLMVVYERDADRDDTWGAERFALTYLFADGIATYYQLFCEEFHKAPWIFLLQDHGFGCNYDRFGKDGLLDAIITKHDTRPEYVICADDTQIWNGYELIEDVAPTMGGMHRNVRHLHKKS